MENFVRKLKRGTEKYKGMLPSKCFNCGKIGNFTNKFPYYKKTNSDEKEDPKEVNKYQKGNGKDKREVFKKKFNSREDNFSSDEDDESNSDLERVLFMDTNNLKNNEEGEVDLEAELFNTLTELKKERKKNKSFKEENIYLKTQIEEGKRKEEVMHIHMIRKKKSVRRLKRKS
jgi:hypothetical protein